MAAELRPIFALFVITCFLSGSARSAQYLGKFLGKLTELHHGVSGEVYAVDGKTLHIKDFTYDGQGPAAYFFAGSSRVPANTGFRIPDENGNPGVLRRYRKEGVTITLPEGKTLNNIKWFSVWCEEYEVNFGDVKIPRNFDFPRPQKIDALNGVHGISSDNVVIVDAQTLLVPNLSYDGEAPDAKFWVGRGAKPSPQGIRVPDENGKEIPLRRYDRKTVVLTLPGELTVFDIGHFGIWCEAFTVDFGHVQIPQNLNVPPSLKMLGVSPQSKLNCEVLHDDLAFEVRWAVAGDSIVFQLVAKLDDREYMSFGLSGDDEKSVMVGGDVVVAWVDKVSVKGFAVDYYLDAKSQCSGPKGSCPDEKLAEHTNNIRLLNAAMVNGYSIITYQRPLKAHDEYDRQIFTNQSQAIIWAIGPLNDRDEVSFHSQYTKGDRFLNFGRPAKWNCPMPANDQPSMRPIPLPEKPEPKIEEAPSTQAAVTEPRSRGSERRRGESRRVATRQEQIPDSEKSATRTRTQTERRRGSVRTTEATTTTTPKPVPTPAPVSNRNAWYIPPIQCDEPDDGVFYAQMGPTGGKRGYPAITGHVGWGISWYINGLLIPEINVVRGNTYTFVVEGGLDPEFPAKYHPFYITDDPVGGYQYKNPEERKNIRIFAGVATAKDGSLYPTGVGRLCHWTHQGDSDADDFDSFGAYQRTLELKCDQGEPGIIQWTPDKDTPNTVYYQCFSHRYLGWKINVLDECDKDAAGSELKPAIVKPEDDFEEAQNDEDTIDDLSESPSQIVESRLKLNDITDFGAKKDAKEKITDTVKEKQENLENVEVQTDRNYEEEQQTTIQTELPIYMHPQQNFFDQSYYLEGNPMFQPNHYAQFNNFQYQDPYQNAFRPSPILNGAYPEEPKFDIITESYVEVPQPTTTTTTTTTSTTTTTTTTTEAPTTLPPQPAVGEPLLLSSVYKKLNSTVLLPSKRLPPPGFAGGPIILRRPIGAPGFPIRQSFPPGFKAVIRSPYGQRPLPPPISFKKPYYRPVSKLPMIARPLIVQYPGKLDNKPILLSSLKQQIRNQPPGIIVMKPQQIEQKQSIALPTEVQAQIPAEIQKIALLPEVPHSPPKVQKLPLPPEMQKVLETSPSVTHVEISPQQASTEREPDTKSYNPVIAVKPVTEHYQVFKMRPAINTGFHPESVIVEGGFKPIISKEIQDRMDDNQDDGEPELEYESEIGVININKRENSGQKEIETFEPMFVPSPLDKRQMEKRYKAQKRRQNQYKKPHITFIFKQPRSIKDDEVAAAAERVESYYLPPSNAKPEAVAQKPTDLEFPPGVVITFDGKRVSGQSLTAKATGGGSVLEGRSSKATELLKASRPQTEKFRGDIPPLDNIYVNPNAPQLQPHGSLSRSLDTPNPPSQGTTKLKLVRQIEERRRKREAHHTPEHTAEQEKEKAQKNSAQLNRFQLFSSACVILVARLIGMLQN